MCRPRDLLKAPRATRLLGFVMVGLLSLPLVMPAHADPITDSKGNVITDSHGSPIEADRHTASHAKRSKHGARSGHHIVQGANQGGSSPR